MASVNKVILIGNLGRDPELRKTNSGDSVVDLSIATTERWSGKDGSGMQEKTDWHRVVVFGRTADNVAKYLKKGRMVYIEGRLQTRDWVGQDGNKRYSTEIVANTVQFLDSGRQEGGAFNTPRQQGSYQQPQQQRQVQTQQGQPQNRQGTPQRPMNNNNGNRPEAFGGSSGFNNDAPDFGDNRPNFQEDIPF